MVFCGERYLKVNEMGATVSAEKLAAVEAKIRQSLGAGQWWALSGSLPPGVPVDIYAQLTTLLKAGGAKVLLDASGESLRQGLQASLISLNPTQSKPLIWWVT